MHRPCITPAAYSVCSTDTCSKQNYSTRWCMDNWTYVRASS